MCESAYIGIRWRHQIIPSLLKLWCRIATTSSLAATEVCRELLLATLSAFSKPSSGLSGSHEGHSLVEHKQQMQWKQIQFDLMQDIPSCWLFWALFWLPILRSPELPLHLLNAVMAAFTSTTGNRLLPHATPQDLKHVERKHVLRSSWYFARHGCCFLPFLQVVHGHLRCRIRVDFRTWRWHAWRNFNRVGGRGECIVEMAAAGSSHERFCCRPNLVRRLQV